MEIKHAVARWLTRWFLPEGGFQRYSCSNLYLTASRPPLALPRPHVVALPPPGPHLVSTSYAPPLTWQGATSFNQPLSFDTTEVTKGNAGAGRHDKRRTNTVRRKTRAQLRSNLEPRKVLGTRAVSRARARPGHLEHFRVSLKPLEIIRRQGCLGVRPGCLERFRLSRGRLELSRAARLSRAAQDISRVLQVISSHSR